MNKRDWQADKQTWDEFNNGWFPGGASNNRDAFVGFAYFAMDALPYWLQQYAVWKAKAYEAEVKAHEAESREKKLREAIEEVLRDAFKWENPYEGYNDLQKVLASLYPEEGIK